MKILGLDQAVKGIGWCVGEPGARPSYGWRENPDYGENTARLGKSVFDWLVQFCKSAGVDRIFFEQVLVRRHGLHMPTLQKQLRVVGAIEFAAIELGLIDDVFEVDLADWRREFYAGRRPPKDADSQSKAWKELSLVECADRGWLIEDHNIAEACGIWHFGCCYSDRRYWTTQKVHKRRAELRQMQEASA